ncbi:MAG: hypothetical protein C0408_01585 [Odoribacter sp.]|nr:hypothetical protein [Odoribacter sp.]
MPVWSQTLDYQEIFGRDWEKAVTFVTENRSWIEPRLKQYRASYPEAIAIVFPELVRYSALRDKIEITLLKALYISLGEEYANFSIGQFQMKPTFAEMIREKAIGVMGSKAGKLFRAKSDYDDIKSYRASIVSDLEKPEIQLNYLIAFVKICEATFNLELKNDKERVRFLATAYNYGFWKKAKQIEGMSDEKYFRTTILKTENYSYSDVSLYWFDNYKNNESPDNKARQGWKKR